MISAASQPKDAQAIPVRVQVIDVEAFALDLVVPTYIPAKDLTQRIARDAGLGAYWEDGTRRNFWLRARGRVVRDDEKLQDFGVVPNELLHLLPQPRDPNEVIERVPDYPPNEMRARAGIGRILGSFGILFLWTVAYSVMLVERPTAGAAWLPALGLSMLSTSFARHVWGGLARSPKVPVTGAVVYFVLLALALGGAAPFSADVAQLGVAGGVAAAAGLVGVGIGWLAWFGAVAPLPKATTDAAAAQKVQAVTQEQCAICGNEVTAELRADCMFRCGRVFHSGCYRARQAMVGNDVCGVCGFKPAT